jgi:tetratricopeptide (TPR) repeat protein
MAARSNKAKSKEKIKTVAKAAKPANKLGKSAATKAVKAKPSKNLSTNAATRSTAKAEPKSPSKSKPAPKTLQKPAKSNTAKATVTVVGGTSQAGKSAKPATRKKVAAPKTPVASVQRKSDHKAKNETPLNSTTPPVKAAENHPVVRPQIIVTKPRTAAALRQILPPLPPPPKPEPRRPATAVAIRAFEHAVKIFNRRQFTEAKELFEQLVQRFPHEVEILSRTQMYLQVCNQKLSAVLASQARSVTADELYDRGVYALNIGDFSQARNCFEDALRLNPNEPHFLYSLAVTHAQIGAYTEALDYLRRSIQMQPRFRAQAFEDNDLSGLRENRQFQELLGLTSPFDLLEARR